MTTNNEITKSTIWQQISEKCSWQAANVMGPLFAHTLMMGKVSIQTLSVEHIFQSMRQMDDMEIGMEMMIEGDLQGYLLVGYREQDIPLLLHGLPNFNPLTLRKHVKSRSFTVRETSNLLAASFFNSLFELCGYRSYPVWVPSESGFDTSKDITASPSLPSMVGNNGILQIDAEMIPIGSWMRGAINCRMLYFPNLSSWAKLRRAQMHMPEGRETTEMPANTFVC